MSDIQDLIHKTSMDCLMRGRLDERQRIIKLLEETLINCDCMDALCNQDADDFIVKRSIALIKGEK